MTSTQGFWVPVLMVWLMWILALAAGWSEWMLRHQRDAPHRIRAQQAQEGAAYAVERGRDELEGLLADREAVTFPAVLKGHPDGVSGLRSGDDREFWLEADGRIDVPGSRGATVSWRYHIEDLELSAGIEPAAVWEEWWRALARERLQRKRDRSRPEGIYEPLPRWVNHKRPVILGWRLDAGIYATPLGEQTDNCAIRLRFYLDLDLWYPWTEDLPLEARREGTRRPVWRWVAEGMPEVNLINHSLGTATGYLPLDTAYNEARPREQRIAAWVEAPQQTERLEGGSYALIREPDPVQQPQGLARLLHRSFPLRPADRVELQLRFPAGGVTVYWLDYDPANRPQEAVENDPLWSVSGLPGTSFSLHYERADGGLQPLYREGVSSGFRRADAQFRLQMRLDPEAWDTWLYRADPRRERLDWEQGFWDGAEVSPADLFRFDYGPVSAAAAAEPLNIEFADAPLFLPAQWPPSRYRDWQMLPPEWGGGLGLGRPVEAASQALLNRSWFPLADSGPSPDHSHWIPINAVSPQTWSPFLENHDSDGLGSNWLDAYFSRRLSEAEVYAEVADWSRSGILQDAERLEDPSNLILTDGVVWARHGRVFAVHGEAELRRNGELLKRASLQRRVVWQEKDGHIRLRWID